MTDVTKKITATLQTERGQAQQFQTVGISRTAISNPYAEFGNTLSDITRTYKTVKRRQDQEANEQTASDRLQGELLASSGQVLPEEVSEDTRKAFHATNFIRNTDKAIKDVVKTYDDEDLLDLTPERRQEIISAQKQVIMDTFAGSAVEDDDTVKKYLVKQFQSMDIQLASAVDKHVNETIPARTMSTQVDMLIEAGADKDTWSQTLKSFSNPEISGSMSPELRNKVIYGETVRAIESGSLEAFNALKESDTYEDLTISQKFTLQNTFEREVAEQHNTRIKNLTKTYRGTIQQVISTGDVSLIDTMVKELNTLPANVSEPVMEKLEPSLAKVEPTLEAMNKFRLLQSGSRNVTMSEEETSIAYTFTTKQIMAQAGGVMNVQEARQIAAVELGSHGIFHDDSTDMFDLGSASFPNGQLDERTHLSLNGAMRVDAAALSKRDKMRIMGDSNYALFAQYKTYAEAGVEPTLALSRAIDNHSEFEERAQFEKANKKLSDLGTIQQSGIIDRFIDTMSDAFNVLLLVPDNPFASRLEQDLSTDIELTQEAPLGEVSAIRGGAFDPVGDSMNADVLTTLGLNNRNKATVAFLEFQQQNGSLDARTQVREFRELLEQDGIIANGNLIMNEALSKRLRSAVGSPQRVNERLSIAMQALAPMAMRNADERLAIQDDIIQVGSTNEENKFIEVTDEQERRQLLNRYLARPDNDEIAVRINKGRYEELYAKGGTLRNGTIIEPLRKSVTDFGGWYDTRAGLGTGFVQHQVDYDDNTRSFVVTLLNRSGERLTLDHPISKEVDGKQEIVMPAGTPILTTLPEDFVTIFMQSF